MDVQNIKLKLKRGELELFSYPGKSECWKLFQKIRRTDTKEEVFGIAGCSKCFTCIVYKKKENDKITDYGTKNLIGHQKFCGTLKRPLQETSLTSMFKKKNIRMSTGDKENVKQCQVNLTAAGYLSFNVMENLQFIKFADCLLGLGAKYGNLNAQEVLFGRHTVRNETIKKSERLKSIIKTSLAVPIQEKCVAFTTDLWSDSVVQRSYLDVTFFWVEQQSKDKTFWELKHAMYACKPFPERKTAENIQATIDSILIELGCSTLDIPVTTDKGSNIVAATSQKSRIDCACHRLNTAFTIAWDKCVSEMDSLNALNASANNLVTFVKKSTGIQSELPKTLKHGGKTRPWRSLIHMFSSLSENCKDGTLKIILNAKGKGGLLEVIDQNLLEQTLKFLTPVESVFDILEYAYLPTLQNVVPAFYLLRNNWNDILPTDSPEIRKMKREFLAAIDEKVWTSVNSLHLTATFLDPTLKGFVFVQNVEDRQIFLNQVYDAIELFANENTDQTMTDSIANTSITEVPPPPITKQRTKADPFALFRSTVSTSRSSKPLTRAEWLAELKSEINHYEQMKGPFLIEHYSIGQSSSSNLPLSESEKSDSTSLFDPLRWWGTQKYKFPILSGVAKTILVIPAASSESERHFSGAGKITRKDRARLKEDIVEALVLVSEGIKKKTI